MRDKHKIKLLDWLQEFRENLVDENTSEELQGDSMQRCADTSSPSHELPMSREQRWNGVRVSTVYIRTFRRTQIVISA